LVHLGARMKHTILLVEDNEDDAFFMQRAFSEAGITHPVIHLQDGRQAIEYLSAEGKYGDRAAFPIPSIIFLDLQLPFKTGLQVLEWIRRDPQFAKIIVIVLTSSSEPVDLNRAYQLGANSFVVKPPTADQLVDLATAFKLWWLNINRPDIGPDSAA
jgi:CheY-like chemotaxis protein